MPAQSIHHITATLLGTAPKTYAAYPVWTNSTRKPVRFEPMPKKAVQAAYRKLKAWNRARTSGRYGGAIGAAALRVFECLIFDFLNHRTGRLDPSYEAIARKTGYSRSTVAVALARLKALGVIHWLRRCTRGTDALGAFRLEQDTNAYAILPPTQWRGFVDDDSPPSVLHPSEWGAQPMLPDVIEQALADHKIGGLEMLVSALKADPGDRLAQALARLGGQFLPAKS